MKKAAQSKAWTTVQIARHPERPQFLDYVGEIFTEFDALHGDRVFGDDGAMIGGLARFNGQPVMIVGQHRGRSTREKLQHNFGMSNPEGYRKSQRLLDMAERFNLPVFTFIDTMGAYPGVGAEERGQAEAIATSLAQLSSLKVPVIATVLGEGGSGGALGIGVADRVIMLSHSIYSVISPEGCASILYKSADKASVAAESLAITADRLKVLGLVDRIVSEPLGGAHRAPEVMMESLKVALKEELARLKTKSIKSLLVSRYERLMGYGKFKETTGK